MPINTPTGYLDITNATLRGSKIVTTGYVGIANANPTNHLSIGSNLHINDTHSNVLQVSGNINAASVVLGGLSIAPTFDLEIVTNTGNTTPYTVEFNNTATAFVTTANATIGDTLTASKLVGDGSGISAIQSSNVTDFASNVSRITALESSRALKTDLDNNSARITTVSNDLSDNSSRITTLESGDISISGDKTFTGDIIFESNVHMNGGNVFVANTVNLTVTDPIIELGSNNLNTNDLGIIMTRHGATNSNIALVYDESDDILRMGYTLNGANDSVVDLDSNALAVSVQGALSAASVTTDDYLIHGGDTDTKVGFPLADTFTVTTSNSERFRVDSSGNVGVGTTSPTSMLELAANSGSSMITLKRTNASNGGAKGGIRFTENTNGYNVGTIACLGDGANTSGALCFYTKASSTETGPYLATTDERMRISSSGNVGIGTSSPIGALDIDGGANDDTTPALAIRGGLYDTSDLYVLNSYNVNTGVGYAAKVMGVNIKNKVETDNTIQIRNNVGGLTSAGAIYLGSDDTGNQGVFGVLGGDGTAGTTLSEYLTVRSNGHVGIGTTNPGARLDVQFTGDNGIRAKNSGTSHASVYIDSASGYSYLRLQGSGSDKFWLQSNPSGDLAFRPSGGGSVMDIKNNGDVGIGTSTPGTRLDVVGHPHTFIRKMAQAGTTTGDYNHILGGPTPGTNATGAVHFINGSTRTADGGTNTYTIRNDSGRLRLGNASFDTLLEGNVVMNAGKTMQFVIDGTYLGGPTNSTLGGNGSRMVLWTGSSTSVPYALGMESSHLWLSTPGGIKFYTGTTEEMTINGNGVGIGTTSPTQKLDVNGVIKSKNPTWSVYKDSTGGNNSGILQYNSTRCTPVNVTLNTVVVSGLTYYYRATITVAGRYFVGFQAFGDPSQSGVGAQIAVYKNGNITVRNYVNPPNNNYFAIGGLGVILDLVVNDYVEIYSAATLHHNANCSFYGFMIG